MTNKSLAPKVVPINEESQQAEPPDQGWPDPLSSAAYSGLIGEWLRLIEPHTEADTAGLLFQLLPGIGSLIGRRPYFRAEGNRHYPVLFSVVVGHTSGGRKGTAEGRVKQLLKLVDDEWFKNRIKSGLSTGEGLVYEVRDQTYGQDADDGEPDKRLFVIEPEFARVLTVCERVGNTLSTTIREAWDCPDMLSPMTKTGRCSATRPHISLIAHITPDELQSKLSHSDQFNGFANRFLWACVRRSKEKPEGGLDVDLTEIANKFSDAVSRARKITEIKRSDGARKLWASIYSDLSKGKPGLLGAVTARAEAQVMRIAMIYAVLAGRSEIITNDLHAALAVWEYNVASCRWIFGGALGDRMADEILRALKENPDGMTRTQLRDHFGRNKSADDISRALRVLVEFKLAYCSKQETEGRPVELWRCTQ